PLDGVLQLANVAGPVVALHGGQGLGRKAVDVPLQLGAIFLEEEVRQARDVAQAFDEPWHVDRDDIDAVVKIGAEASGVYFSLEIDVAGEHDADIDRLGLVAAAGFELLFRRDGEKLNRDRRGGGVVLAEEGGGAATGFDLPGLSAVAPVKAPFTCPNSSLSSSVSGMAPHETA